MGFIRSVEVTRSKTGDAHPHFHALLLMPTSYFGPGYLSHEKWVKLWREALRVDYDPSVHIKAVKPKPGADPASAMVVAVLETLKYSVKESDLTTDAAWLYELTTQLHRTRAVAVGGVLSGFLSDTEPDDLIHDEAAAVTLPDSPEIWFGWKEMIKRYRKIDH